MGNLNIGEYKERITVYKVQFTTDEQGGRQENLEKIGEYWAKVEIKAGHEVFAAMKTQVSKKYKFFVIGALEITEANIVEWNNKLFDVRGVGISSNVVELICEETLGGRQ